MAIPLSSNLDWSLANSQWASSLNPIIANPLSSAVIMKNIALINGSNIINTALGKMIQGWFICDITAPASIYRSAPFSGSVLTLTSSAATVVSIGVF